MTTTNTATSSSRNRGIPIFQSKIAISQSEQLFNFLKSLGYDPPKHLKPEHLDYLFKNNKTTLLMKALISNLKPGDVLGVDEVEKRDRLQEEGVLLYGEHLEKAVKCRLALDKNQSEHERDEALRTEELERLIALRKKEILEIQKQTEMLRIIENKQKEEDASKGALLSQYKRDLKDLAIKIPVSKKLLGDKLQKLGNADAELLTRLNLQDDFGTNNKTATNDLFLADLNWDSFIKIEDELHDELQEFTATRVLIPFAQPISVTQQQEDDIRIRRIVDEYLGKFERLRHSIAYEELRKVKLSRKLKNEEIAIQLAIKIKDAGVKNWLRRPEMLPETELENRIKEYSMMQDAYTAELKTIWEKAIHRVDSRYNGLVEPRNVVNKRRQGAIAVIYEVLEAQKIRIDVCKLLESIETNRFEQFKNSRMELEHHLATLNLRGAGIIVFLNTLTFEGKILWQIFDQLNYPKDTILSTTKTFHAITQIYHKLSQDELKVETHKNADNVEKAKKLSQYISQIKNDIEILRRAAIPPNEIVALQSRIEEKSTLLDTVTEEHSSSDIITKKKELLASIKACLKEP